MEKKINEILDFNDILYKFIDFDKDLFVQCYFNKIDEKNLKYLILNNYGIFICNEIKKDIILSINWKAIKKYNFFESKQNDNIYIYLNFLTIFVKSFNLWFKKDNKNKNILGGLKKHIDLYFKNKLQIIELKYENTNNFLKNDIIPCNIDYIITNLKRYDNNFLNLKEEVILSKLNIKKFNNNYIIKSYPKNFLIPLNSEIFLKGTINYRSKGRIPVLSNIFKNKDKSFSYVWRSSQPNVF